MWLELARDAKNAANALVADHPRSCVSRTYYAAFSRVAHELVTIAQLTMQPGREGPSHTGRRNGIRRLVLTSMPNMTQPKRDRLSDLLGRLYTLRIDADYKPSIRVEGRDAREAVSIMRKVFDLV